eukprot:CAMPEP_0117608112 /NCGR_PEP_ID=MMETSP0784-20121206/80642_1 /TAXON_ID=39447 /ORGANISM="" /LENGTH=269 /DNA_ID=CAMNT_0005411379 /DNA_START=46 /DNA_END=853 /DNA_ORIENTATION=-
MSAGEAVRTASLQEADAAQVNGEVATTAGRRRAKGRDGTSAVLAQVLHERSREGRLAEVLATLPSGAPLPVTVCGLTPTYLPFVERLNRRGLPCEYGAEFYDAALQAAPHWSKVALWDGCVVGAVICGVSEETIGCIHVRSLVAAVPTTCTRADQASMYPPCRAQVRIGLRIHRDADSKVPRHRVASRLLQAIVAEAEDLGFRTCSLHVHVRNAAAIALYASLGWRVEATVIEYYQASRNKLEAPPDALFMVRVLQGGTSNGVEPLPSL